MSLGHLLNFSTHALTSAQLADLPDLLGVASLADVEVHQIGFEIDWAGDFLAQCREQVGAVALSSDDWQGTRLWVILPDLAAAAAVVLTEVNGRAGHFPELIWRHPRHGVFSLGGVASLDEFRLEARRLR